MKKIYLDFNASTPIAPEVAEAMCPYLAEHYGNPSSRHWAGAPAKEAVEAARGQVAALLACSAGELVFTSGGTESNNHAIKGVRIEPFLHGAGHENGRRAGTENVLLNVALGAACELAEHWVGRSAVRDLRDRFWKMLRDAIGDAVVLNGHPGDRLPNTLNVSFVGRVGSDILARLEGVAASTGSACHEGTVTHSPVLQAMGISPDAGMGAVRFSLGRTTTPADIEYVAERVTELASN